MTAPPPLRTEAPPPARRGRPGASARGADVRPASAPLAEASGKRRTKGFDVIAWIERHCVFTKGDWIGKPFRLLPWQKRVILELFTIRPDGLRQYRWAYISVAKKNGKTELAAAIGLYLLIGDGEAQPWIACAAASDDQADLVFGAAKTMCELSPTLRQVTQRFDSEITVPSIPGSRLQRVAAVAGTNDGPNLSAVICDELHEWAGVRGENVWTVLTNGTINRRQPLVLQITTAGYDRETICGRQYDYAVRVLSGEVRDPAYYVFIAELPEGAPYRDEALWPLANPSFGVTVSADALRDQLARKPENVWRRYFGNQWTETEESWLPPGAWDACVSPLDLDPKLPAFVGVRVHDQAAVVITQLRRDGRAVQRARVWLNPYPLDDLRHQEWRLDRGAIETFLAGLAKSFPKPAAPAPDSSAAAPGPAFFYDPTLLDRTAELLTDRGLNMLKFDQTEGRIAPASMSYYEAIVTRQIAHDGDPAFARQIASAVRKDVSDRAWRLTRPRGTRKAIDAALAGAISYYGATRTAAPVDIAKPFLA